ncbi:MAG: pilus assembly protein PilM [Myxococcota bacterium]
MATVYGIDTGSWRVRIAAMEGSFRRFEVRDAAQVATQTGDAGEPLPFEALDTLRKNEPGWEAAEKAAAVPLDAAVARLVRLPFTDRNAIARAIPAEVESQVPYDLEDMVLASRVIDARDGASRSLVLVAPRDDLRARIDAFARVGSEPRVLCVDADALASYADRGVQAIVDVGHRRTVIALCQNGQLLAGRLVGLGGLAVTRAVAEAGGVDEAQAEAWKHEMVVPPPPGAAVAEWEGEERTDAGAYVDHPATKALVAAVEEWMSEVRAELISLEDELGVGVDEVLFCGGGSRLRGLGERLAASTGVPARTVLVPGGHPVEYALAVALARAGAGELRVADLRTGDLAYHGHAESLWNTIGLVVVGSGLAMIAAVTLFTVQFVDAQRRLNELDAKMAEVVTKTFPDVPADRVSEPSTALAIMQEKSAATAQRVEALGATVSGVPPTLDMLKVISERVPPHKDARIDVRELTISEEAVTFKAETDSYESAAKIEEALRREPRFGNARKADEKKVGEALTFTMNIPLGETAAEEGEEG